MLSNAEIFEARQKVFQRSIDVASASVYGHPGAWFLSFFTMRALGFLGGVDDVIIDSVRFQCSFVSAFLILLHNQGFMPSFFGDGF